ncbi:MAG: nucleotidyltransferase family protein [Lachnospiraceae bacterium]|nr:nucleotidyltransferase family protein [Lachnospiraceae bacterium]
MIRLARKHRVLPLLMDRLYNRTHENHGEVATVATCRSFRDEAGRLTIDQAQRTADFLLFYEKMKNSGLDPAVMKGLILRSLYPEPELRASVDEDLLIEPGREEEYHRFLVDNGFMPVDPKADLLSEFELSYENPETGIYLELHKTPFSPESEAYSDCNRFFENALERTVCIEAYDTSIRTLCPTDHLLYLICHAYKHFLHGGFGIRQVFDIGLFTQEYKDAIDWDTITAGCRKLGILTFSGAIYAIVRNELEMCRSGLPAELRGDGIDEMPLLRDILEGGLYGAEDPDRHHSAAVTLDAVSAARTGRRASGLAAAVFPGKVYLKKHYPYAEKHPYLLPAAWAQRIVTYLGNRKENDPKKSLSIGRSRVELLRKYGIIS